MNPKEIKQKIRDRYGDIRFAGSRQDGDILRIVVETGELVTESHIEADYHSEHFETDEKFVVLVDPDTGELLGEDTVR